VGDDAADFATVNGRGRLQLAPELLNLLLVPNKDIRWSAKALIIDVSSS